MIATRGLVRPASRPHKPVRAAMVAEGTGHLVLVGVVGPVRREHRVEHPHGGDQAELNDDDEYEPGGAGADEGEPERPARA